MRGATGDAWRRYILRLFEQHSLVGFLKHDPTVPTRRHVEYCARNLWLTGSPQTVAEKLAELYEASAASGSAHAVVRLGRHAGPLAGLDALFARRSAARQATSSHRASCGHDWRAIAAGFGRDLRPSRWGDI